MKTRQRGSNTTTAKQTMKHQCNSAEPGTQSSRPERAKLQTEIKMREPTKDTWRRKRQRSSNTTTPAKRQWNTNATTSNRRDKCKIQWPSDAQWTIDCHRERRAKPGQSVPSDTCGGQRGSALGSKTSSTAEETQATSTETNMQLKPKLWKNKH